MDNLTIDSHKFLALNIVNYFHKNEGYVITTNSGDIWLENFEHNEYQFVLISARSIVTKEEIESRIKQLKIFKRKLLLKHMMLKANILYIDISNNQFDNFDLPYYIDYVKVNDDNDFQTNPLIKDIFAKVEHFNFIDDVENINEDIKKVSMNNLLKANEVLNYQKKPIFSYMVLTLVTALFFIFNISHYLLHSNYFLYKYFLKYDYAIKNGEWWRLITASFAHVDPFDFLFSFVIFLFLGKIIERGYGYKRFSLIVLFSAFFGMLFNYTFHNQLSLGMYTINSGLIGAGLYFSVQHRRYMGVTFNKIIMPLIMINGVINLIFPSSDSFGYLGGFVGGLLIANIIGTPHKHSFKDQLISFIIAFVIIYISFNYGNVNLVPNMNIENVINQIII